MKLGKKSKAIKIENPFRPPQQFPRKHSVCRITHGSTLSDDPIYKVQVDADFKQDFWAKISTIPHSYYCNIYEMWFTTNSQLADGDYWLDYITMWAQAHYDEVHLEDIYGKTEIIKKRD